MISLQERRSWGILGPYNVPHGMGYSRNYLDQERPVWE